MIAIADQALVDVIQSIAIIAIAISLVMTRS